MEKQPISIMIHDLNPWGGQDRSMLEIAWQLNKTYPLEIHSYSLEGYKNWPNMTHVKYESLIKRPIIFKYLSYHHQSRRKVKNSSAIVQSTGTASLKSDVVQVQFIHHTWNQIKEGLPEDKTSQGGFFKETYHNWLTNYKLELEKKIYTRDKKYIAISHGIKKELMEHFNIPQENISIIYHGVDTENFAPYQNSDTGIETRARIRKQWNIKDDEIVLLHVGALNARKGIFKSLETMQLLKTMNFDKVKLMALGAGDQKILKKYTTKYGIDDSVIFCGHSQDIREYYWAADVFFLPTYYEPFGLVILEAMACGLPVATTLCAGASELTENGISSLLFDRDASPEQLCKSLNDLLKFPEKRKEMGEKGREISLNHTWEQVGQNYRDFYGQLLRQPSSSDR